MSCSCAPPKAQTSPPPPPRFQLSCPNFLHFPSFPSDPFPPYNVSTDSVLLPVLPSPCCVHGCIGISVPVLSESYLVMSSVFLWRQQTVCLSLPFCPWCILSSFSALVFPGHLPTLMSLLFPPYLTSWVPSDFLLLKGVTWKLLVVTLILDFKVTLPPPSKLFSITH